MLSNKEIIVPNNLLNAALKNKGVKAGIVNAGKPLPMLSVQDAVKENLIDPIFIGDGKEILKCAEDLKWDISKYEIINEPVENNTAGIAAKLASEGKIRIIVKGHIHTDILMKEVLKREYNLLGKTRLSHIWHMTLKKDDKPLIITDGALNISPSLETKKHILSNVLDYIKKISSFNPYVAVLSATEEKLKQMPSSIEAHDLVEWAKINYSDTPVEGPFALDNAISQESAKIKGTAGKVPGNANVIIVPNIETGNALVKSLVHFANATAGGFVIGGKSPVVITSRSDDEKSRMASIINAVICTY